MIRLSDFITKIRNCKTQAEERAETQKEMASIRESFNKNEESLRLRNVTKLLFINMMGQDTDFGQMECLKLISAQTFIEKRIGYLGLTQLFHETSQLLMMATNRIRIDLSSPNNYIAGLTLCILSEICTEAMAEDLSSEVLKLTASPLAYIKKKAFLTAGKIIKKAPQHIPDFLTKAELALEQKSHGVLLGVVGFLETVVHYQQHLPKLVTLVPKFEKVYRSLMASHSPEYEISGTNDPFLQVGILHLLRHLFKVEPEIENNFLKILMNAKEFILESRTNNNSKNGANSVLFECFQGLVNLENAQDHSDKINQIILRFISVKDANSKYLTLYTLKMLSKTDLASTQQHRGTIFDCLSENDKLIRSMALDLLYVIATNDNVVDIVKDLEFTLLRATDEQFISEIAMTVCLIVDKHSPSRRWNFDTILKVLIITGQAVKESSIVSLVHLITSTPQLQSYAMIKVFFAATSNLNNESLNKTALYLLGQFSKVLLSNTEVRITEEDIFNLIESILLKVGVSDDTLGYGLNCLVKLHDRVNDKKRLINLIHTFRDSPSVEVQKRSLEYSKLVESDWNDIRNSEICAPIPALASAAEGFRNIPVGSTEGALSQIQIVMPTKVNVSTTQPTRTAEVPSRTQNKQPPKKEFDIFGGDEDEAPKQSVPTNDNSIFGLNFGTTVPQQPPAVKPPVVETKKQQANIFDDLFTNDTPSVKPTPVVQPVKQQVNDLSSLNLYGNQTATNNNSLSGLSGLNLYANTPQPTQNQGLNLLGNGGLNITMQTGQQPQVPTQPTVQPVQNLGFNFLGTSTPSSQPVKTDTSFLGFGTLNSSSNSSQTFKGYENQQLQIVLACSKEGVQTVNVVASFNNKTASAIDNLVFQVAFTKHLKIVSNNLTSTSVQPHSTDNVQQKMRLTNTSPHDRSLTMKLKFKLSYTFGGQKISEEGMITNFPEGY